jgi:hypothetical protein
MYETGTHIHIKALQEKVTRRRCLPLPATGEEN